MDGLARQNRMPPLESGPRGPSAHLAHGATARLPVEVVMTDWFIVAVYRDEGNKVLDS